MALLLAATLIRPAAAADSGSGSGQPGRLTGTVVDPAGKPMAGLRLLALPEWRINVGEIKTDANGRFDIPWNPRKTGGMNERVCLAARDQARNLIAIEDVEEDATRLDLRLEPGMAVAGRIQDVEGKALTNATISFQVWVGNGTAMLEREPLKVKTDGRFEFSALARGRRYWLWVTAPGYGSGTLNLDLQDQDNQPNRLELQPFTLKVADRQLAGKVVDAEEKPVANVWVSLSGNGQPSASAQTDKEGRFKFNVCEGQINLYANLNNRYVQASAEAGDTNVVLSLTSNPGVREAPARLSLKGKPLPDLTTVGLGGKAPAGKSVLLCLFDVEQRPSRRFLRLLGEQCKSLEEKGVTLLGLQAAPAADESLKELLPAAMATRPVGRLPAKTDKASWSAVESLPWLILTDTEHKVVAEGFALEDLEAKLKER